MKISCFIFDLDGTLIDSLDDLTNAVNYMRKQFGSKTVQRTDVQKMIGCGIKELLKNSFIYDGIAISEEELQKALDIYGKYYAQHQTDATVLYPGVPETLAALQAAGIRCAVATNKTRVDAQNILRQLGVMQYIDSVVGDDGKIVLKPAPDSLYEVARQLNVPIEECVMVGDNYTDLGAARAAGIRSVFCRYGLGFKEPEEATFEIDSITELENMLV